MKNFIKEQIKNSFETKQKIYNDDILVDEITKISNKIINCYKKGGKVLIAGNGGSAADAQHIAGELVNKFYFDRPALSAMALSTDTSVITAVGNDDSFDKIFSRQIEANGKKGDVFIGISTSGNSKDIIEAIKSCKRNGIIVVGLTGNKGGNMDLLCDHLIKVPSSETPRIQESHMLIYHTICAIVEESIFGKSNL